MLEHSANVDAFVIGSISADILFCEVDLSAHVVFLEILPNATQNGVMHASVEYIVEVVFLLVMQESYIRIFLRYSDFYSELILNVSFS